MLICLGATNQQVECVNVTRLKNHLLTEILGFCEHRKGTFVLLTLDGATIFEAASISGKSEGMIICKAATIIRKQMFLKEDRFDGNLSTTRQRSSISTHLPHLIGLILEGANNCNSLSDYGNQSCSVNSFQLGENEKTNSQ